MKYGSLIERVGCMDRFDLPLLVEAFVEPRAAIREVNADFRPSSRLKRADGDPPAMASLQGPLRQPEQSFAAPHAHDSDAPNIAPVNDAERGMNQLPQKRLLEFGNHAAHIRMIGKPLNPLEYLRHEPLAGLRRTLLDVPRLQFLQIPHGRFGKSDGDASRHGITPDPDALWLPEGGFPAFPPGPPIPRQRRA